MRTNEDINLSLFFLLERKNFLIIFNSTLKYLKHNFMRNVYGQNDKIEEDGEEDGDENGEINWNKN